MVKAGALFTIGVGLLFGSVPGTGQAVNISTVVARLRSCVITSDAVTLDVVRPGQVARRLVLDIGHAARWQSRADADAREPSYALVSACPESGDIGLRIMECDGCLGAGVIAAEVLHDDVGSSPSLLVIREFFDRLTHGEVDRVGAFAASVVVSRHNRTRNGSLSIWVRDRIARTLDAYSSKERAAEMIRRFGRSSFLATIEPVHAIRAEYGERIGVSRVWPYVPSDPRSPPFVGAWPGFPFEIRVENDSGDWSVIYLLGERGGRQPPSERTQRLNHRRAPLSRRW